MKTIFQSQIETALITSFGIARCLAVFLCATSAFAAVDNTGALWKMDLASSWDWTLAIDDGLARGIKVPGGGFNSDQQESPLIEMCGDGNGKRMVKDHVTYQRTISADTAAAETTGRNLCQTADSVCSSLVLKTKH